MRVALCLQGQPRNWKPGVSVMKRYVIDRYNADVFGHTWWDKSQVGNQYDTAPFSPVGKKYFIKENDVQELIDAYKFKVFETDKPRKFIDEKQYKVIVPEKHDAIIDALKSRYYSLKRVLTMAENYEKENNITYDWLCISRYDLQILDFPLNLVMLNPHKYYVEDYTHAGRKYILCDNFWIFGKKHRFVFKTLFDNFDKNWEMMQNIPEEFKSIIKDTELETCDFLNGEQFMAFHLLFNNALQDSVQTKELCIQVIA